MGAREHVRCADTNQPTPRHVTEVPLSAYANVGLARIALVKGDTARARDPGAVAAEAPQFSPRCGCSRMSIDRLVAADADRFVYRANRLQPFAPYLDPMVDDLARESRNSTLLLRVSSEANLAVNAEWASTSRDVRSSSIPTTRGCRQAWPRAAHHRTQRRSARILSAISPDGAGGFSGLAHIGSCLSAMGRYQQAESYLRRAVAGIDDPQTHYNLGLLLSITNRTSDAIAEYEKALARDPMHADARLNMAPRSRGRERWIRRRAN